MGPWCNGHPCLCRISIFVRPWSSMMFAAAAPVIIGSASLSSLSPVVVTVVGRGGWRREHIFLKELSRVTISRASGRTEDDARRRILFLFAGPVEKFKICPPGLGLAKAKAKLKLGYWNTSKNRVKCKYHTKRSQISEDTKSGKMPCT